MMDVTEQAKRSDALYYSGNDGINRRWLCDKVASLEAENAKLRELAKGLYEFAYAEYPRAAKAGFADDLRELGIEVNG